MIKITIQTMVLLKVQEYLRGLSICKVGVQDSLGQLKAKFAIEYKQHSKYPQLWLLKYNQIESNFSEELVRECRGLILDSSNNWNVVAMPFKKFFNSAEHHAAEIDWKKATVLEKLDGSLTSLWCYNDEFNVSTSGCPDGTNQINDMGITFGELFWKCFNEQGLDIKNFDKGFTYMFELTSPYNRVVVDHKISKITLIGIRDPFLREWPVDGDYGLALVKNPDYIVKSYSLASLEDCLSAAAKMNPLQQEGFVAVGYERDDMGNFPRQKIKSPSYVALHHMKDRCGLSKLADVIRQGEYQEMSIAIKTYPELEARFLELVQRYNNIVETCNNQFDDIKHIENQKDFALLACKTTYSTVLFTMRKTGKSPQLIMKEMLGNAYLRLMGVK